MSDDEARDPPPISHIVTMEEMLIAGLALLFSQGRIKRARGKTNLKRFNENFGVYPLTACHVYEHLQTTAIDAAKVDDAGPLHLQYYLVALYFLRLYPTRGELEQRFDISKGYIAKKCWEWVARIAALKEEVITFCNTDDIWIMTVDGTHVWIQEPNHPVFSQDKNYYSHKYNKAGMSCEIGISLKGGVIWLNGPFPAGTSDLTIFRKEGGLRELLRTIGKRCIADRGYRAEEDSDVVSSPNFHDSAQVALFKSRALMRHENFNSMTKVFQILAGRFHHSEELFSTAFTAVCVLCQYKLQHEKPLYDVLIPAVIDGKGGDNDGDEANLTSDDDGNDDNSVISGNDNNDMSDDAEEVLFDA
jgi:hypothetical protein